MGFQRVAHEVVWRGQIATVCVDRLRHDDGEEVTREYIEHPGAVCVVAHHEGELYMVSQPREAVGEQSVLELPAGKLDTPGESALDTAKRELAEEVGKGAASWRELTSFYSSPGFTDETIHLYLATDLYEASARAEENERIEIVKFALERIDAAIARCRDAKSLVGLLWFRAYELG